MTFVAAISAGTILIALASRLRMSPIVLLLAGGILLGPGTLGLGIIRPSDLGNGLNVIIHLAVALILFEGGLSLDPKGYRTVSSEIRRALTVGVLVTWIGCALTVRLVFCYPWAICLLAGSLVIVTGPTVIGPLLKRIGARKKIHDFLHWESVLIDPIGVFISLLCYEWIIGHNALGQFGLRIFTGISIGILGGLILTLILKRRWVPSEGVNLFVVAGALGIFTISHILVQESGLLSVIIAGFVLGFTDPPRIDKLRNYKSQLVETLIGLLFILLAANLRIDSYGRMYMPGMLYAVAGVLFLVRPVNVFLSLLGRDTFTLGEKLFLGWIAPRGIVAASMASVFAMNIQREGSAYTVYGGFLELFTYSVIIATILIQGLSARPLGRLLGVLEPEKTGWLIVGAHPLGMKVADFIIDRGYSAILMDTNLRSVSQARKEGFRALFGNAIRATLDEFPELYGVGNILAITVNEDLNQLICHHWQGILNHPRLYKWSSVHIRGDSKDRALMRGRTVWKGINIQELIVMMGSSDRRIFTEAELDADRIRYPERVIMCSYRDRVYPYLPPDAQGKVYCLFARSPETVLDLNTRPDWIILSREKKMQGVLRELLEVFKKDHDYLDTGEIYDRLLSMEAEFPSSMGNSVAIPHTYLEGLADSAVLVAVSREGVEPVYGGEPVRVVFLVLSPTENPGRHILILSQISRFIINEENRSQILSASSREELVELFFPEQTSCG